MRLAIAALALVTLAACSSDPDVDWAQFAPGLQDRIDSTSDCASLQHEFDAATDGDLLEYIDQRLKDEGCY